MARKSRTPWAPCPYAGTPVAVTPSERVLASKGAKPRYTITFKPFDAVIADRHPQGGEAERRDAIEAIKAKLAYIDSHPHKDPKPRDPEAVQRALRTVTEVQRVAAEARLVAAMAKGAEIRMVPWDPRPVAEECACNPGEDWTPGAKRGPHKPMGDGRCAYCDRPLEVEAASAPERELETFTCGDETYTYPPNEAAIRRAEAWSEAATDLPGQIGATPRHRRNDPRIAPYRGAGAWSLRRAA